jgi:hypothetical protein
MTATPTSIIPQQGMALGSGTVLFAQPASGNGGTALYAYDETSAGPRFTMLTPVTLLTSGIFAVNPTYGPPSSWFVFDSGNDCELAQIVVTGGVPALGNTVPISSCGVYVWGTTASGQVVAATASQPDAVDVYSLGSGSATHVAQLLGNVEPGPAPIADATFPFSVVGWFGADSMGGVACLASHPDYCWPLPEGNTTVLAASATAPTADGSFALDSVGNYSASMFTISFLHTMGSGTRPQPLP